METLPRTDGFVGTLNLTCGALMVVHRNCDGGHSSGVYLPLKIKRGQGKVNLYGVG